MLTHSSRCHEPPRKSYSIKAAPRNRPGSLHKEVFTAQRLLSLRLMGFPVKEKSAGSRLHFLHSSRIKEKRRTQPELLETNYLGAPSPDLAIDLGGGTTTTNNQVHHKRRVFGSKEHSGGASRNLVHASVLHFAGIHLNHT